MSTTGAMPPTLAGPPPVRHDTTRTIAVVALVVALVAVLVQAALFVVPVLALGLFGVAGVDSGAEIAPAPEEEALWPGSQGGSVGGLVAPIVGGAVTGEALRGVIGRDGMFTTGDLRCDDVARPSRGTTSLCRTPGPDRTFVAVEFTDDRGGFTYSWFTRSDD